MYLYKNNAVYLQLHNETFLPMKVIVIIFTLILTILQFAFTQDYQTFNSGRTVFFEDDIKFVVAVRIDSVEFDVDSTLYPFRIFLPDENSNWICYASPSNASWIGPKVIIKENSDNLFFNKDGDTITIQTNALLGESWTFYQTEELIIIAEVVEWNTQEFLGVEDAVKKISFQAFNGEMINIDHPVNNHQLLLSENYGLLSAFNFYFFPETNEYEEFIPYRFYFSLIGISNPEIGFQNPTTYNVHDFQPEDELHIRERYETNNIKWERKTILKYLERLDANDSIVYKIERYSSYQNFNTDSTHYFNDTIYNIIKPYVYFDRLPLEPNRENIYDGTVWLVYNNDRIKKMNSEHGYNQVFLWYDSDDCYTLGHSDGGSEHFFYYNGLGGTYFHKYYDSDYYPPSWLTHTKILVYYKKGDEYWGEPLLVTNIKNDTINNLYTIYPNPAINDILVNSEKSITVKIEIFELTGRIVSSGKVNTNEEFNISNLNRGIYLIRITDEERNSFTQKLIKQ